MTDGYYGDEDGQRGCRAEAAATSRSAYRKTRFSIFISKFEFGLLLRRRESPRRMAVTTSMAKVAPVNPVHM
jgi:hypothetical protein